VVPPLSTLARVELADRDAPHDAAGICVAQAGDEAAELLFERRRDRDARTRAEQHRREVLDAAQRQRLHDIAGHERLRLGAKVVEVAEADEHHRLGEQQAARRRQPGDLAEPAVEHPPPREFLDGAAEPGVHRCGRARRVDVAEHAEHDRARVRIDDAAVHEPDLERAETAGHRLGQTTARQAAMRRSPRRRGTRATRRARAGAAAHPARGPASVPCGAPRAASSPR
jgi:hypothetical protein